MDPEIVKTKVSGTLLGVVVGDLLGEQVEGLSSPGIIEKFRSNAKYTDDTEMTLITLQHLLTFKTIKALTLAIEYCLLLKEFFLSMPTTINYHQIINDLIQRNLNQRLTDKIQLIKDKIMCNNSTIIKYDQLFQFVNHDLIEHSIRASDTLALV